MPLRNTIQDRARSPSKVFMYMHFNKPIITSKIGESAEIFSDYDFYYNPDDSGSMSLAIEKALFSNDNWSPKWNPVSNTWDERVVGRIEWLKKNWPKIS
jgi:glycosyltransferase involved in cell wall biosynthesis